MELHVICPTRQRPNGHRSALTSSVGGVRSLIAGTLTLHVSPQPRSANHSGQWAIAAKEVLAPSNMCSNALTTVIQAPAMIGLVVFHISIVPEQCVAQVQLERRIH